MIKAVCFDLDGTLVNSERLYLQGNVDAAQQLGLTLDAQHFLPLVGISAAAFQTQLDQMIPGAQQAQFIALTQAFVDHRIAQASSLAQPGADSLLRELQAQGLKLAIVTASSADYTKRMLINTGWLTCFDAVITGENRRTKPAADLYLEALHQLQLPQAQVLAVEDSLVGIQAAHAAGLRCVQVQDLAARSNQADAHVANLFELKKILRH